MVTFSAFSGGIGSSLIGGNFWEGFVIGGTVAGLNDALHEYYNKKQINNLLKELSENGVQINSAADFNKESVIQLIANSPTLTDLWSKANYIYFELSNKKVFTKKGHLINAIVDEDLKQNKVTKEYTIHEANKIILYQSAFKTLGDLAFTLGHELIHAHHIISGFSLKIYNLMKDENAASNYL